MKIHYLRVWLWVVLLSAPALSLASTFSVYPSQYDTYNRPADGYPKQQTAPHQQGGKQVGANAYQATSTKQAVPQDEHPQQAAKPATGTMSQRAAVHDPALKYVCPMHPDVISNSPGHCPICGMELVSLCTAPKGRHLAQQTLPSLSDMPRQGAMAGMMAKGKPAASPVPGVARYVCPMHPEIVRHAPGHCPICGMDLVQKTGHMDTARQGMAQMMPSMGKAPRQGAMAGMMAKGKPAASPVPGAARYVCPMHPEIVRDAPGHCPICGMDLVQKAGHQHHMEPAEATEVSLSPAVVQKMGVRTASVRGGSLTQSYKTVGRVRYDERRLTQVFSRTFGWVDNLSVRTNGAIVQRGQLLLELYSPEYLDVQKAFLAAQQQDHSAGHLKRYGAREQTVPSRDYLRYLEVPESAINELARTGKPRFRLPIYAPQYGVIIRNEMHKHMYVAPGQLMFTIADLSSVWVEVELFEQQLSWLRRKLKAELQTDALPGQKLQGWVNYIYPELDPRTRTVTVRLLVNNPGGVLRPNMLAQVEIFAEPKTEILTIPREALIDTGESQRVILALGDGRFRAVEVAAGLSSQGRVEIVRGLKKGDKVVVSGQFLIDSEANLQASLHRYEADGDGQGRE